MHHLDSFTLRGVHQGGDPVANPGSWHHSFFLNSHFDHLLKKPFQKGDDAGLSLGVSTGKVGHTDGGQADSLSKDKKLLPCEGLVWAASCVDDRCGILVILSIRVEDK